MVETARFWKHDAVLRIAGMLLVATCWLLMRWLVHSANLRAHRDPALLELAAAAAGFLCVSTGSALTTLGAHVFDEVEVSERWVRRRYVRPPRDGGEACPAAIAVLSDLHGWARSPTDDKSLIEDHGELALGLTPTRAAAVSIRPPLD